MRHLAMMLVVVLLGACSQGSSHSDGSSPRQCTDYSGAWQIGFTCSSRTDGAGAGSAGGYTAHVTQTNCSIQLVQKDDKTTKTWTSSGTVDASGKATLSGEFGFASGATCTGSFDGTTWTSKCSSSTEACDLSASRLTR